MSNSTLITNGYNPYLTYNNDILSLIENEKKLYESKKEEQEIQKSLFDIETISNEVIKVLHLSFDDVFHKKDYKKLFEKDRWKGIAYILIIISIVYYINKI